MHEKQRALQKMIRAMPEEEALSWVLNPENIEEAGFLYVMNCLPGRSWKKKSKKIIAKFYIELSFPGLIGNAISLFFGMMSIKEVLDFMPSIITGDDKKLDLFLYHLKPYQTASSVGENDKEAIRNYISNVKSGL